MNLKFADDDDAAAAMYATYVTFHLSMADFHKPTGSIVQPLEVDLPKMMKVETMFIYLLEDKVVIREYKGQKHSNSMVMIPSTRPGEFAVIRHPEFDYFVQCFFEEGGLRSLIQYLTETHETPKGGYTREALAAFSFDPDRCYHLGLGYEFRVCLEEQFVQITATENDRAEKTRTLEWHLEISFTDLFNMFKDIRSLLPQLPVEERNCLAHFPLDHANQEGMWACIVCQFFNDDYHNML
ncbi:unnamed protein product [Owenia fusiformis]|uniref:Uncharacterized protein n=1 Tax=Owenia fusiformis TaxID=6347 RepID=A0A8J1YBV2_OWEFU|nr:unnamed protein product [Owenia fusiformis]